ncbi:MAG: hypothetical protein QOF85_2375 [Solirubrobacterales bacterium]|jgi:uncharacterized protein (DUF1697 family)|nr:hypothetical protein [Solirubrobacterales bacterium]
MVAAVESYVAFLRGMNLGGRRIKNTELSNEFKALGFSEVACFRASGNVVFATEEADEAKLTVRIETDLGEALGYEVPVFLRSADELRAVAEYEPFDAAALASSKGKVQIAFLTAKPKAAGCEKALALATEDDRLAIEGRELYWLPEGGLSESDLDLKTIAAALGPTTIRTRGTVEQIVARYFA